ncbi:MAG: hypothetical protein RLZZ528_1451 [Pseudomonadota bacterium]
MPVAPPSEPYSGLVWRLVEGQHVVATMALVDSLQEQAVLEAILETTKPPVPEACRGLHYLMYSPFRYGTYPSDSRFRRRGRTPGVFYASENPLTAAAETVWYRFRFFDAAPGVPLPLAAADYTALSVLIDTPLATDLTKPPLAADHALWTDPGDYSACLDLADRARAAGIEAIRYASVRDPEARANLAVLTCRAFAEREPAGVQSWRILLRPDRALVVREFPRLSVEYLRDGGTRLVAGEPAPA